MPSWYTSVQLQASFKYVVNDSQGIRKYSGKTARLWRQRQTGYPEARIQPLSTLPYSLRLASIAEMGKQNIKYETFDHNFSAISCAQMTRTRVKMSDTYISSPVNLLVSYAQSLSVGRRLTQSRYPGIQVPSGLVCL